MSFISEYSDDELNWIDDLQTAFFTFLLQILFHIQNIMFWIELSNLRKIPKACQCSLNYQSFYRSGSSIFFEIQPKPKGLPAQISYKDDDIAFKICTIACLNCRCMESTFSFFEKCSCFPINEKIVRQPSGDFSSGSHFVEYRKNHLLIPIRRKHYVICGLKNMSNIVCVV